MPQEGEVKDGKMYWNGEWIDIAATATKKEHQNIQKGTLTIGKLSLEITAWPDTFEKSGRRGYKLVVDQGQVLFGNGNLYMRAPKTK